MSDLTIAGFAGSLRRASMNRGLLRAAQQAAPDGMRVDIHDIDDVPLFNLDVEAHGDPPGVTAFKDALGAADGILIAVPEHNFSMPGVLKNALDWASRKQPGAEQSVLWHKPVALMGAGGSAGTSRSQLALRQVLTFSESYVMPGPQLFLFHAASQFDENGDPTDDTIAEKVRAHLDAFADWIRLVRPG